MPSGNRGIVVAIDGPSGAGKSTVSELLAKRLGYIKVDTGSMYRSAALLLHESGTDFDDVASVEKFCRNLDIKFGHSDRGERVIANGKDVTDLIRTPEISLLASRVSAIRPVREAMMRLQREMGKHGGVVLEGRDIGTVVFPDAEVKFFLSASTEERGKRRYAELIARGEKTTLQATINDVAKRDEQDMKRDIAPLRQAGDAVVIDSSGLSAEQVLDLMEKCVKEKKGVCES